MSGFIDFKGARVVITVLVALSLISLFVDDVISVDGGVSQQQGLWVRRVVGWSRSCRVGYQAERLYDMSMIEAGHQAHVSVAVVNHHEGGISDFHRCLVVTLCIDACLQLTKADGTW